MQKEEKDVEDVEGQATRERGWKGGGGRGGGEGDEKEEEKRKEEN